MSRENERIKKLRTELGLTQAKFAERLGVSKQYLSRVENGLTDLSKEKVALACANFNVSADWLIAGYGHMFLNDEKINQKFFVDMENLNDFNRVLNTYNTYIKNACIIIDKKYPDATYDEKLATASILFNQDCMKEKITFNDIEKIKKEIEKNKKNNGEFEAKVLGTYYFVRTQNGRN